MEFGKNSMYRLNIIRKCNSKMYTYFTGAIHPIDTLQVGDFRQYNLGSDYVSGARTNYRNSMCPASGYVTARKNCCKPICPAPGKIGGSDCVLNIICPASVDVTGIRLPQIYLSGERPKNMSQLKSDVLYCAIIY